uniref:Ribosome assembly factor mrt4 n=1 Tax=Elaeophora elaphi TaxID=1147741 RepID=A0A158Q7L2_9BILA
MCEGSCSFCHHPFVGALLMLESQEEDVTLKMPKSKREVDVSLTRVKKKTRKQKMKLVDEIRKCVDTYENLFVFGIENMRSAKFVEVRQKYKNNSRFFYGKNNVMAIALGKTPSTEYVSELNKVSSLLKGECGLMFTNEDQKTVKKYFDELRMSDFARCGQIAVSTIELCEGPLMQFPFSLEPQLRKLGLPIKLEKGVVTLLSHYVVCKDGDKLTADQCKLLKLLDYKMSTFHVKLFAHWSRHKVHARVYQWSKYFFVIAHRMLLLLLYLPFIFKSFVSWTMGANVGISHVRNFSTILEKVLRRTNKKPLFVSSTMVIQEQPQTASIPTKVSKQTKNLRFSESNAYFGIDKRKPLDETIVVASQSYLEAFDSAAHRRRVVVSFLSSLAAVCFYFWYSRSDYDGFLNAPKYEVIPTLKRYALRQQIERAQKIGKDTTYLKAALEYVDVEEAVYRAEEGAFTLEDG